MNISKVKITAISLLISFSYAVGQNNKPAAENNTSVLSGMWNKLVGSSTFTQKDLVGKWGFKGTACTFETENLLKKAGGAVVASQVENKFDDYCKTMGIKEGNTSFIFNADSTYSAKMGLAKLSGKFRMDEKTKLVTMSYMFGVGKMHATAVKSGSDLKLMFDSDSFLKLMKFLSKFSNDTSVEILAKMADMYDGMLLGFDLNKQKTN